MPLQAPNLDDRRYADILAEAKTLIPRYTPEWTDHNASDPGITLIELFAWMTDMLLYRLNQVPERNYIKFLQLLGVELKPARPAGVELTFTLSRDDLEVVIVPKGARVAVADSGGEPLVFETDEALIALGAKLVAVQSFDSFSYSVETTKNQSSGQWYYPFGKHARPGSALLLGFDSPLPFTSQQVNLMVYINTAGRQEEGSHCDLELEQMPAPAGLVWEYWDGRFWQPVSLDKDETRAFTRSGHLYFQGPGASLPKTKLGKVENALYWVRCRLESGEYETAPRIDAILTSTVHATQALTVRDEVLGGSNGRPNQAFQLANRPVVTPEHIESAVAADGKLAEIRGLRLEVDEGSGFKVWREVEDFYASGPEDTVYTLNRTTGEVHFGGGHGRIPTANPANSSANVVARQYRYGGGKRSNVGAGTVSELQTYVEAVKTVTNNRPAEGGSDEETVAEAKLRAPMEIKSRNRAVTAEDFEFLALQTPGVRVRRAKALALTHPRYPDAQIPGCVTVIVVPDSDAPDPLPSENTLSIVCAHLNKHRLLTTEVYVVPPHYHLVSIEANLIVRPEADLAEVKKAVEKKLATYFHPLLGGENGTGWPFGGDIFYSDVYRVLLQQDGVERIENNGLYIWLDNERQAFCQDICIEAGALLYSTAHTIRVSYRMQE
ncbi:MAG: putative baseplate assembly protein [Chloroflexota bacterium]